MKLIKNIKVKNDLGLHIRPAAFIVKLLQSCKSSVFFSYKSEVINARSIMSILTLVAKKNANITIIVEGEDAKTTMSKLISAFNKGFNE